MPQGRVEVRLFEFSGPLNRPLGKMQGGYVFPNRDETPRPAYDMNTSRALTQHRGPSRRHLRGLYTETEVPQHRHQILQGEEHKALAHIDPGGCSPLAAVRLPDTGMIRDPHNDHLADATVAMAHALI